MGLNQFSKNRENHVIQPNVSVAEGKLRVLSAEKPLSTLKTVVICCGF